ncbi:MAG: NAD(P)-dependent malic enzyme [Thermoguttaceae bacterium]|jgi:malate dehydrogenase (oxaloacetate-decarboxylating)
MNNSDASLKKHGEWRGKIEVVSRVPVGSREELSLAYTPGVARPCKEIQAHPELSFELTRRWNTVPVITDGTAVLGLGDVGPEAGMPVMEGKCALFKAFGDVDAFPLCIRSKDADVIVETIKLLQGSFGGVNLEDISAPRCFEIEQRLKKELEIPVFHDDQHGTAIVTIAALINAAKLLDKKIKDSRIVINGAGAAGIAIARFLLEIGATDVSICDSKGLICDGDPRLDEPRNILKKELAKSTNLRRAQGVLADAMVDADIFIGVSTADCVTKDMIRSMKKDPIMFTCANPVPEIPREDAFDAGAAIVGTGSSQYPNQINNVLVFPGLFRGALDVRATDINFEMRLAAAQAIANVLGDELSKEKILPFAWEQKSHDAVAKAVAEAARKTGVAQK